MLNMLLQWVKEDVQGKTGFRGKRERMTKLRRAEQARLNRIPNRLRAMADEVAKLISHQGIDPRTYLPPPPGPLIEGIVETHKQPDGESVREWVNIPNLLNGFASYVEMRYHTGVFPVPPPRPVALLWWTILRLVDHVKRATGRPHYQEVADLLTEALSLDGSEQIVTADNLRKVSKRNARLRQRGSSMIYRPAWESR
jgi:hypothetical protein